MNLVDKLLVQDAIQRFQKRDEVLLLEVIKDHVITTDEQNEEAGQFVKDVKAAWRLIDDTRQGFTAPCRELEQWVNDQFRPVLTRLKDTEATLKRMLGARITAQQAQQRALAAKAAELAPKAVTKEAYVQALAQVQQAAPVAAPGVSARMVTKFRYTDPNLVPREFCCPDDTLVGLAVSAGRAVPGVEVYQEQQVTVRR